MREELHFLTAEEFLGTTPHSEKEDQLDLPSTAAKESNELQKDKAAHRRFVVGSDAPLLREDISMRAVTCICENASVGTRREYGGGGDRRASVDDTRFGKPMRINGPISYVEDSDEAERSKIH